MKKTPVLLGFALLLSLYPAMAEDLPALMGTRLSLSSGMETGVGMGRKPYGLFEAGYDAKKWTVQLGASLDAISANYSANLYFEPIQTRFFTLGLRSFNHFCQYLSSGYETDISGYLSLGLQAGRARRPLRCRLDLGVNQKQSGYEASGQIDSFTEYYPSFSFLARQSLTERGQVYFACSSFDDYYVPLFLAPIFSVGADYRVRSELRLGAKVSVRYSDMATLTAHADGLKLQIFADFFPSAIKKPKKA
jgi:hypothetical protein